MGSNHLSFHAFLSHPSMSEICSRSTIVHVVLPGQVDGAEDLPETFKFPTMDQLGNELVCVLDQLRITYVVGFGDGTGANILARFALVHPKRCLGIILMHPTSTKAGLMEYMKDKLIGSTLKSGQLKPTAEDYLVFHKFGEKLVEVAQEERDVMLEDYTDHLKTKMNPKNLNRYVQSFVSRTDISAQLCNMSVDVLIVVGSKASHLHTTQTFHSHLPPTKSSLVIIDGVGDVLVEAADKVAHSLLLFLKGCGILPSVRLPGQEVRSSSFNKSRGMSMEDYDKPTKRV
ncbi:PREDICTED: uncharacterized protein ZK1073.1-like isoform X2 [Priapulus caudatus]|nr:PREDICTED: uncharacterized protein ZK1073.1-like isoform X2 [Priapulus caudatus]